MPILFCSYHSVCADEISDLKEKVKQLEVENHLLKDQLKEHNISLPQEEATEGLPDRRQASHPEEPFPEKSLATLVGLTPPQGPFVKSGFIDLNYYYDDRNFNVMTVNLLANLPADIQYFTLMDLTAPADSRDGGLFDLSNFYMEHHFRRPIAKDNKWLSSLDWTVQYVDGSAAKDLGRLGTRVRLADVSGPISEFLKDTLKLWYNIDFHWYESDGKGYEIEHAYGGSYLDGFITLGGFADHDFDDRGENTFVTEHQVGLRIVNNLYYVTEFKYNHFRAKGDRWGTAFGLEYRIPF